MGQKLDRQYAIAILRELLSLDLIHPSWVALNNTEGKFSLMLKADCSLLELKKFLQAKNLLIKEASGFCIISKPKT